MCEVLVRGGLSLSVPRSPLCVSAYWYLNNEVSVSADCYHHRLLPPQLKHLLRLKHL